MVNYGCEKCGKEFSQKGHYTKHLNKKNPCIVESKVKEMLHKVVQENLNKLNLNKLEQIIDNKYTFIEVCAGAGGLSCGLIKSGFTPILLNDNNKDCCKTLKQMHPDANIVCDSMDKIDYSNYIGKVDLLTGGVPCQSFSQAGLRKGLEDPRGDLMFKFIDILNLVKPKLFMIENVKGLITHENGETIKKIIRAPIIAFK